MTDMNQENMDHELEARYEKYKGILKNLQGRSAILDCVVRDGDGRQFDVEIQQDQKELLQNEPDIIVV